MSGKESEISRQCDLPLEIAPSNNTSGGIEQQKQSNNDENLLNSLGYKQEFRREFTRWSTLSYAISIIGVLGSVPATWSAPLAAGGPTAAVWTWFSGTFFSLCIALSIAELVSAYPTSGGIYFVTKHILPPERMPLAAWAIGWLNFLGQTAGVASVGYSIAQMVTMAAASMGSVQPDGTFLYSPSAETTVAVSIAVLFCQGLLCSIPSRRLSQMIRWFAPTNILGSVAISIAIFVLAPNRLSAKQVFNHVTDSSGWNSKGFSFLISYLSVAWTMTDYDATAHMSEELHNAAVSGPIAIFQAVLISGVFGLLLNIAFGFGVGNVDEALSSPMGNPAAHVFLKAGGRNGGLAMWFWAIMIQFFTGITAMLSNTRTCFALARDEMFPFSRILRKLSPRNQTPLYSIWAVVIFCCCLNLVALGSTQTINGIFGVTAPALDLSYVAVIAARLYYHDKHPITPGPFRLGRFQKPINYIAIAWTTFISIILFFPPSYPVTALNMNYAVGIVIFISLFALCWWYAGARGYYIGPRTETHREQG